MVSERQRDSGAVIMGTMLTVVGVALLLDRTGTLLWTGRWSIWPLLLIGYGIARMMQTWSTSPRGLFPLGLGLWLLAGEARWLSISTTWPLMLVVLGLGVVWRALVRPDENAIPADMRSRHREHSGLVPLGIIIAIVAATRIDSERYFPREQSDDRVRVVSVLGQARRIVDESPTFQGGEMITIMAGNELDLRKAQVGPGGQATVEVFVLMAGGVIRVPDGWIVDVNAVPVMAGIRDRRFPARVSAEQPATAPPRLVVKGVVMMGGLDIKS